MSETANQKVDVVAIALSLVAAIAAGVGIFNALEAVPQDEKVVIAGLGGIIAGLGTSLTYGYYYGFRW